MQHCHQNGAEQVQLLQMRREKTDIRPQVRYHRPHRQPDARTGTDGNGQFKSIPSRAWAGVFHGLVVMIYDVEIGGGRLPRPLDKASVSSNGGEGALNIRTYQVGDEKHQAAIYNEAAAGLPRFKPATVVEIARRRQDAEFDPETHFFAEEDGQVVGYALFHANGRVSYPWCRPGYEHLADPLAQRVLLAMTERGLPTAAVAYRGDWPEQYAFWERRGFRLAREMINYVLQLSDMPTRAPRPTIVTLLQREDVPAIFAMIPGALRVATAAALEQHMFHNRYFPASSYFVLRQRDDGTPAAVGILIQHPEYADPTLLDADMPCFRLGAFGTEGMQVKRVNCLFSFLTPNRADAMANAFQLLEYAAARLENADMSTLAAQVPSDIPHLARFYRQQFQRQGSFPVYEKDLRSK